MRAHWLLSLPLILMVGGAAAGAPFRPSEAPAGAVTPGRCHMDACVWKRLVDSQVVARPNQALVVRLTQQVALVDTDQMPVEKDWEAASTATVTCSYARPTVAFTIDGEETTHALTLSPEGTVYGYQIDSVLTYFQACHNLTIDETSISSAIEMMGYDVIIEE